MKTRILETNINRDRTPAKLKGRKVPRAVDILVRVKICIQSNSQKEDANRQDAT
jgi:hypothetical protein